MKFHKLLSRRDQERLEDKRRSEGRKEGRKEGKKEGRSWLDWLKGEKEGLDASLYLF